MSSKTKFTPGPWVVDPYGDVQANGEDVARVVTGSEDAHLIAAAPELYEALKLTAAVLSGEFSKSSLITALENARDALAKARGEA